MEAEVLAGIGSAEIHYTEDCFPTFRENYTGVHDAPTVHIVLFSAAESFAFAVLDQVNVANWDEMRSFVGRQLGLAPDHVFYHVNHTLSCPHSFASADPGFSRQQSAISLAVRAALLQACKQALQTKQPVKIGHGKAVSMVNVSRVIELADGWWQGRNDAGASDHEVQILRIDAVDGAPLGILYFVNAAPGALEGSRCRSGGRLISGDIAASSNRQIESLLPGAKAAYLLGASADQWVRMRAVFDLPAPDGTLQVEDLHETGFTLMELQGRQLGSCIASAAAKIKTQPVTRIAHFQKIHTYSGQKTISRSPADMRPCRTLHFEAAADVFTAMDVFIINHIAILMHSAEVTTQTVREIRQASPFDATCFMAFTNGASGYMVTRDMYETCSMQCRKSVYAAGSAEQYAKNALHFLREIHHIIHV